MAIASSKDECKQDAGVFAPVVDRTRCEAKEDCVEACPYDVFEMRKLDDDDKRALPFVARVKAWVHGNRQAFAVRADECHACGLCVTARPAHAIQLVRVVPPAWRAPPSVASVTVRREPSRFNVSVTSPLL